MTLASQTVIDKYYRDRDIEYLRGLANALLADARAMRNKADQMNADADTLLRERSDVLRKISELESPTGPAPSEPTQGTNPCESTAKETQN